MKCSNTVSIFQKLKKLLFENIKFHLGHSSMFQILSTDLEWVNVFMSCKLTIRVMKHIPLFFFLISYCNWFNAEKAFSQSPSRIDCLNNEAEVFSKVVSDSLTNVRAEFSRPTLNKCWPIRRISSSSRFENFRRPFSLSPSPVTSPFVPFVFPLVILELLK